MLRQPPLPLLFPGSTLLLPHLLPLPSPAAKGMRNGGLGSGHTSSSVLLPPPHTFPLLQWGLSTGHRSFWEYPPIPAWCPPQGTVWIPAPVWSSPQAAGNYLLPWPSQQATGEFLLWHLLSSFFFDLGVCRVVPHTFFPPHSSLCVQHFAQS